MDIIIDPRIIRKYSIKQTPAVLYIKNYIASYNEKNSNEKFWIYYGAVDFEYAIREINRYAKSQGLKSILKKI